MKNNYQTKEMQAYCTGCPKYVAMVGCGKNKTPDQCRKKVYETKENKPLTKD